MQAKIANFNKVRLLYLQSPNHQMGFEGLTQNIKVYTSGTALSSVLHLRNYDFLVLDMAHKESTDVLQSYKQFFPCHYVIACCSEPQVMWDALKNGADAILMDPSDEEECERAMYKATSFLNMQDIFQDRYYLDNLTSTQNSYALDEKATLVKEAALIRVALRSFKAYQVHYGHEISNRVLIEFGDAIKINLPINAELFRTNEDEFSILLSNPSPSQENILSAQIKAFFEHTPIEVDGFLLKINTIMGISTGKNLIQKAEIALSEAKSGFSIVTYDKHSAFIKAQYEHIKWVKIIQEAISEDKVNVVYQPIMNNTNANVDKYEVLCRIEEDKDTFYMPNDFIPSAILAGRMCDITRIVIDKSFKYFQDKTCSFSINITREDFLEEYLLDFISYKCDYYNIAPERIDIEVLENISTESAKGFISQINALKDFGCNVSIDDFGVDSSNFARMMLIQAEVLKIDGNFIQAMPFDENAKIIVQNIVDFSKNIGAKTVAEYVDSPELHKLVIEMGIDYSQGFFIGEPRASI